MEKVLTVILILMVILTVIYVSAVVYVNTNANSSNVVDGDGKRPTEYGIWRHYFAEKLETEPQEWNTTEELGIIFSESKVSEERYHIYIVDPEKALPWMKDIIPEPDAIKYEDNFYNIVFAWVTPGIPERVKQWQMPLGVALGACWVFTGVLFLKGRKKESKR